MPAKRMTLSLEPWKKYEPFCVPSGPRDKYTLPFVDPEDVRFSISEILYVPLRGNHAEGCGTIAVRLKRMTRKIETQFQHRYKYSRIEKTDGNKIDMIQVITVTSVMMIGHIMH